MEHVQITLVTKSPCYSVPSTPITLAASSSSVELDSLLFNLLEETQACLPKTEFVFLINGEYLNGSIGEHLSERQIVSELLEVEYCEKQRAPSFFGEIKQDDLISSVKRKGDLVLTGSYDGTVQLWTVENPKPIFSLELDEKVKCVEWLTLDENQATFVTGGFDQTAQLWVHDRKSNEVTCVAVCRGHSETVMTAAALFLDSNSEPCVFATGSWDGTIKLWSASPKATDLSEETGGIAHTRKSTSKTPTRIPRLTLAGHRETITRVCWLPTVPTDEKSSAPSNPKLISASWDHTLRVWDCQVGQPQHQNTGGSEVRCIVSSHAINDADATLQGILTASSDNRVRMYDLRAREALALIGFPGHTAWLTTIAWAPHRDNHFVTGSIDRSVRLWDTRNPKASLYDLMGHTDMVTDVDWAAPLIRHQTSDRRHYILSSSADGTVKIYNYPE
ncbi:Ribosome biogenesis protein WDR12 [Clonorchis sinensis]|uniref:Ribosome biogenesis protein WDR12 n=1 Tax=Clonorchis sinensis TaxID=79923 RepID=A0A8T1MXF2_CLOSI|nr:Ribosome biogenesis protein WDR12 [Clonorchis sinensis]